MSGNGFLPFVGNVYVYLIVFAHIFQIQTKNVISNTNDFKYKLL